MKNLNTKFIVSTILFSIIQIGFFSVADVYAYHSDTENSESIFSARSLDFVLVGDGFENHNMLNLASTSIEVKKVEGLNFQYKVYPEFGDRNLLCDDLRLKASLNNVEIFDGYLKDFLSNSTTTLGVWKFELSAVENAYGYCDFDFVYQGWQEDFSNYDAGGFRDEERSSSTVFIDELPPQPEPESCIKINEIYYYPGIRGNTHGFEDNPNDEWIELYNVCDHDVNIKNWYFVNEDNSETITQNYILETHQFVVISANSSTWSYWPDIPDNAFKIALGGTKMFGEGLDDFGDVINLYDDKNNLIDSVSWGDNITAFSPAVSSVILGHSISRKEKGVDTNTANDWMDTYAGSDPVGPNPGTNPHPPLIIEELIIDTFDSGANSLQEEESVLFEDSEAGLCSEEDLESEIVEESGEEIVDPSPPVSLPEEDIGIIKASGNKTEDDEDI
ncbi:hypothetical protein A3I18_00505 [Candidatus Campbellbacteria bacterium RIFCSPLOWO2_02_FULL_35_11]|uniref:LTD domain-containing protein n=1 Tax=Candidatus Campbellbacteria bacterium RIFCSPLOWO2_02_FULL_35_11 TaxID=1797581 RepID=A0A1F5ESW1_9BACT|nr:MAG: hypothetical protein A3I18_00505 [Candidatus Campbellbacteria bacterium RIFCSPLOWO2_02_FULL_35_11]